MLQWVFVQNSCSISESMTMNNYIFAFSNLTGFVWAQQRGTGSGKCRYWARFARWYVELRAAWFRWLLWTGTYFPFCVFSSHFCVNIASRIFLKRIFLRHDFVHVSWTLCYLDIQVREIEKVLDTLTKLLKDLQVSNSTKLEFLLNLRCRSSNISVSCRSSDDPQ